MVRAFMSYAYEDRAVAAELRTYLAKANVPAWVDSTELPVGTLVDQKIREAIKGSSLMIVLLSPVSARSPWVQAEIGAAMGLGKPILPIIIRGVSPEEILPEALRDLEYLDARNLSREEVVGHIIQALK